MKCEQNYLEIQQCFGTADSLKLGYEFSPTPGMHAKQQISNTLETEILSFFHLHFLIWKEVQWSQSSTAARNKTFHG